MRKNNVNRMTVVEQIIAIMEDTCEYICKDRDRCSGCPMNRLHYLGGENGRNKEVTEEESED